MTSVAPLTEVDAAAIGLNCVRDALAAEPLGGQAVLTGSSWRRTVRWYDPSYLGTPAFWVEQTRQRSRPATYQIGSTLLEEVALCLLGGYGITEHMAYAAFTRCQELGLLTGELFSESVIHSALSEPLSLAGHPRTVRYRFPQLKAQRLAAAIAFLDSGTPPRADQPRELRDWLTGVPGVGLKTASWVVRNLTRSDAIAVIDIHIRRAGVAAGMFDPAWKLPRDYLLFEEAFVAWAYLGGVGTADLDACIWSSLATLGRGARSLFGVDALVSLD
ncbi:hypothetical protein [Mycobacterium sp. 360MFTsu5.1]|uniref:8-oxoguanine DNA glycosylase n=1 Tax=Mycobacterium sp. 360MFTsu5.1 TaxID=1172186 RepID=UPI0003623917|nr:hypothetical protein [Mycobacterium sp. 360MFTsu5.1]